jgi:hypothetical protein
MSSTEPDFHAPFYAMPHVLVERSAEVVAENLVIMERLLEVVTESHQELSIDPAALKRSLSQAQQRVIRRNPTALARFYGTAVERRVVQKMEREPLLADLRHHPVMDMTLGRPDFGRHSVERVFFDLTTARSLREHVTRFEYGHITMFVILPRVPELARTAIEAQKIAGLALSERAERRVLDEHDRTMRIERPLLQELRVRGLSHLEELRRQIEPERGVTVAAPQREATERAVLVPEVTVERTVEGAQRQFREALAVDLRRQMTLDAAAGVDVDAAARSRGQQLEAGLVLDSVATERARQREAQIRADQQERSRIVEQGGMALLRLHGREGRAELRRDALASHNERTRLEEFQRVKQEGQERLDFHKDEITRQQIAHDRQRSVDEAERVHEDRQRLADRQAAERESVIAAELLDQRQREQLQTREAERTVREQERRTHELERQNAEIVRKQQRQIAEERLAQVRLEMQEARDRAALRMTKDRGEDFQVQFREALDTEARTRGEQAAQREVERQQREVQRQVREEARRQRESERQIREQQRVEREEQRAREPRTEDSERAAARDAAERVHDDRQRRLDEQQRLLDEQGRARDERQRELDRSQIERDRRTSLERDLRQRTAVDERTREARVREEQLRDVDSRELRQIEQDHEQQRSQQRAEELERRREEIARREAELRERTEELERQRAEIDAGQLREREAALDQERVELQRQQAELERHEAVERQRAIEVEQARQAELARQVELARQLEVIRAQHLEIER